MDMFLLVVLSIFVGFVINEILNNAYIHLVVGSIMTDIQKFFKKLTKRGK